MGGLEVVHSLHPLYRFAPGGNDQVSSEESIDYIVCLSVKKLNVANY